MKDLGSGSRLFPAEYFRIFSAVPLEQTQGIFTSSALNKTSSRKMLSRARLAYRASPLRAGGPWACPPKLSSCAASDNPNPASDTTAGGVTSKTATATPPPCFKMFEEGKKDGPTILFVHGWPDDHTMWNKQVGTGFGFDGVVTTATSSQCHASN